VSAADAYLERARSRTNLSVLVDSPVRRLLVEGRRVRGVVLADGRELAADRTVVSAGAVHSPAILLRSGIDREGIGRNLHDHASAAFAVKLRHRLDVSSLAIGAIARFSSGVLPADLQLLPVDHHGAVADAHGTQYGSLGLALMKVRSRGSLTLDSDDPEVEPRIDFDLLSDDRDTEALARGVSVARTVLSSRHFETVADGVFIDDAGTSLGDLPDDLDSAAVWLRSRTGDYVHAAGTCAMGDGSSPDAVVDPECRVIGMEGLLVCDASIFPDLPRANTHFPVMMAAERLADRW
jgi:choline dehydrogenase/5-(hydroxymethyl)furfural/furfural oxidase